MIKFLKNINKLLFSNKLLSFLTILNISLTVIIISSMLIAFVNGNKVLNLWQKGLKIIAYIDDKASKKDINDLKNQIKSFKNVKKIYFISKKNALEMMKTENETYKVLFENLQTNPLPNALEIFFSSTIKKKEKIKYLAKQIEALPLIDEVEYGQNWIGSFLTIFKNIRNIGIVLSVFFILSCILIVITTIKLSIFSKNKEIEIMYLIGADTNFIGKTFYKQSLAQSLCGSLFGIFLSSVFFFLLSCGLQKQNYH